MKLHTKTRSITIGAILAGTLLLGGCTSSHPSAAWQGPGYFVGNSGNSEAIVFSPRLQNTGNLIYMGPSAPEFGRRDHTLSTRDLSRREELFGVRGETHTSLNNRRTFRASRRADEYNFPSTEPRRYHNYRRYYRD